MRYSPRNRFSQLLVCRVAGIVALAAIFVGCGPQSVQEPGTTEPLVEEAESKAVELPTERPEFLDVLAAAARADAPLPPGEPLPALDVEGWINGNPSNAVDSAGSIVVIECWAYS